jgi:AcrR family transcriptional regulator
MTMPARTRNPRGEGDRLRDEVIEAAIALLDETNDPGALTLRGIARRAGISAPSIYAHFSDLPRLVEAVLARSFDELRAVVAAAIASEAEPARALVAAGRAYVEFGWKHRARYGLMFSATGYSPNAFESFALVEGAIRRCVEAGDSESTDPHLDAWILWAGLHGVATLDKPVRTDYLRLGPLDRPAMLVSLVLRLARIPPQGGRLSTNPPQAGE